MHRNILSGDCQTKSFKDLKFWIKDSGSVGLGCHVITSISRKMVHRHIVADAELLVDEFWLRSRHCIRQILTSNCTLTFLFSDLWLFLFKLKRWPWPLTVVRKRFHLNASLKLTLQVLWNFTNFTGFNILWYTNSIKNSHACKQCNL